jgi:hypothetical protein
MTTSTLPPPKHVFKAPKIEGPFDNLTSKKPGLDPTQRRKLVNFIIDQVYDGATRDTVHRRADELLDQMFPPHPLEHLRPIRPSIEDFEANKGVIDVQSNS